MTLHNLRSVRAAPRLVLALSVGAVLLGGAPAEARRTDRTRRPAVDSPRAQNAHTARKSSPRRRPRRAAPQKKRAHPPRRDAASTPVKAPAGLSKKRNAIVKTALALEGKPYQAAGKGPARFDCSGLTHYVMKQHGITVTGGSRHQIHEGKPVPWSASRPGDLVFFRREGRIAHVGVVVDNTGESLLVVHATSRGVVVDDVLASSYWRPQLYAARDLL